METGVRAAQMQRMERVQVGKAVTCVLTKQLQAAHGLGDASAC